MAEGAWGSFSGFVGTLWDIIPVQAIWDPQGYTDGLITIGQGLAHNVTHTGRLSQGRRLLGHLVGKPRASHR
jgi:hypothetical protein